MRRHLPLFALPPLLPPRASLLLDARHAAAMPRHAAVDAAYLLCCRYAMFIDDKRHMPCLRRRYVYTLLACALCRHTMFSRALTLVTSRRAARYCCFAEMPLFDDMPPCR